MLLLIFCFTAVVAPVSIGRSPGRRGRGHFVSQRLLCLFRQTRALGGGGGGDVRARPRGQMRVRVVSCVKEQVICLPRLFLVNVCLFFLAVLCFFRCWRFRINFCFSCFVFRFCFCFTPMPPLCVALRCVATHRCVSMSTRHLSGEVQSRVHVRQR